MYQSGRGSRRGGKPQNNAWNMPTQPQIGGRGRGIPNNDNMERRKKEQQEAEKRFQEAKAKLEENVQKHLCTNDETISSDEDDDDIQSENIMDSIMKNYSGFGSSGGIGSTQQYLEDIFQSGAATCLICICSVRRNDAIWSCKFCYNFFHMPCIQKWATDTIAQLRISEDYAVKPLELLWTCPKCRANYEPNETPQRYFCFCGNTQDPPFQPWILPHSCGETCNKKLKPDCGHNCTLLCHPGPCPPCPQNVKINCFCGKKNDIKRCSNKTWSCASICNKTLTCKTHRCKDICHGGECKPCPKTSLQFCCCGNNSAQRPCASPTWKCNKQCGKLFSCGIHKCEVICHDKGKCGECPFGGVQSCPCGKTSYKVESCTDEITTCGDTCGKLLTCGIHNCQQRCHTNQCGMCLQLSLRSCRCGLHKKELPCGKEFICEIKCKKSRNCLRHPCNKKCCDGSCPPCEKPCGKTLKCGNHKCASVCHRGPCYPCPLLEQISCACANKIIQVPCGKKNKVKPPVCNKNCQKPSECPIHPIPTQHKCHFSDCPPCKQTCYLQYKNCPHKCPANCHMSEWIVTVIDADKPLAGPWEKRQTIREKKALPCPPCEVPVLVTCVGGHEQTYWPCHKAIPTSCGRICGQLLPCGNHTCSQICHSLKNSSNPNGKNCSVCENACALPRPEGCTHPCPLQCHQPPCENCKQIIKRKCHCGLNQILKMCYIFTNALNNSEEMEQLLSCGNRCSKNYECGHRCRDTCHSGICNTNLVCRQNVKVFCPCKRISKSFACHVIKTESIKIDCDFECGAKEREKQLEEERKIKEQELKDKEELEKFEKRQKGKKRHRERYRNNHEEVETKFYQKISFQVTAGIACTVLAWFTYNLLSN